MQNCKLCEVWRMWGALSNSNVIVELAFPTTRPLLHKCLHIFAEQNQLHTFTNVFIHCTEQTQCVDNPIFKKNPFQEKKAQRNIGKWPKPCEGWGQKGRHLASPICGPTSVAENLGKMFLKENIFSGLRGRGVKTALSPLLTPASSPFSLTFPNTQPTTHMASAYLAFTRIV